MLKKEKKKKIKKMFPSRVSSPRRLDYESTALTIELSEPSCLRVGVWCVDLSVCGCWLCVCGVGAEFLLKIVGIISPPIPCRAFVESFLNKLHESC